MLPEDDILTLMLLVIVVYMTDRQRPERDTIVGARPEHPDRHVGGELCLHVGGGLRARRRLPPESVSAIL